MKSALLRLASLTCLTLIGSLAASLTNTREAAAHTLLVSPPPISPDDGAKSGPCGCEIGGDPACPANFTTTTLNAGSVVLIKWKETVLHTGDFRLAFSTKPPDQVTGADLDANVLYDKPDANNVSGGTISTMITVPNTPCDPCTLQLRQFMAGAANPYYYSCASVRIVEPSSSSSSSSGTTGPGSGAGGSMSGGAGGAGPGQGGAFDGFGGSTGPGLATPPDPIQTGGCSAGGAPPGAFALLAFGALGLVRLVSVSRARRRRGPQLDRVRSRH